MFEVSIYVAVAYLIVAICLAIYIWSTRRAGRRPVKSLVAAILAVPFLPYAIVEVQTAMLWHSVSGPVAKAVSDDFGDTRIVLHKVLWAEPTSARVYVVTAIFDNSGYRSAIVPVTRTAAGWTVVKQDAILDAVWADGGSADGNVFPPYLGKGDFH